MKLEALFDTRKAHVRVHAAGCAFLNRSGRTLVRFDWTETTRRDEELDEREIKVAFCKCVPAAHRLG